MILRELEGKVALVTGSSRGIGQAAALRLAEAGALVALNATRDTSSTEQAILGAGGVCSSYITDVRDDRAVEHMVQEIVTTHGGIDILLNNAGINRDALALRLSKADWDDVMATNLGGTFNCTRSVLRHMIRKRSGRIINVGSVVGLRGNHGQSNYTTTKSGLIGFTRSIALEVASRGITANVVAPGFIDTAMTTALSAAQQQLIQDHIPLKKFGTPIEVSEAVVFLASDRAAFITGQVLYVDGGLVLA